MEVPQAFSDLLEVSSQVENAIVLEEDTVAASSISDESRSEELAAEPAGRAAAGQTAGTRGSSDAAR